METQFPANNQEERHLNKAFELLEADRVKTMLAQHGIHREAKVIRHDFRKQTAKWWMAAAVLLFATASFFIYVNISQPNPQQLADNSLSTLVADYNFTYRSSESASQLSAIQNAISNEQWNVASKQLESALAKTAATDTNTLVNFYFYKGIVDLEQNNFDSAVSSFTSVVNFNNGALQKDAIWLRALAHIKNKNLAAAKVDLKLTAQYKGWKKADEAAKILQAMGDEN